MKAKDLIEFLKDKEDFEIVLIDREECVDTFPTYKQYNLLINDVAYSEKIITLVKDE